MLISPSQAPSEPMPQEQAMPAQPAGMEQAGAEAPMEDERMSKLQALDDHINSLPQELQAQFENGFRKYDDLPELFGMLMPDAYEYFKLVQEGVRGQSQQPQPNSPAASPSAPPAGEQAQAPLLGSAEPPAKATSAFAGMAQ